MILVLLDAQLRNFTKLPILRYLGICNVLYIWHIRAIPTIGTSSAWAGWLAGAIPTAHPITSLCLSPAIQGEMFTNKCQTMPPLIRLHVYHIHMNMYYNYYYGKYENIFMIDSYVSYMSKHVWKKAQAVIIYVTS